MKEFNSSGVYAALNRVAPQSVHNDNRREWVEFESAAINPEMLAR
jgi:hypothetical protein